jgi:phosphoribosylformimino-5-aminoimidazole carboxamide ribotide isomerase
VAEARRPIGPPPVDHLPVQIIPAIDLENGRSRIVYWPGAAAGVGAPTDRPERIAARFVDQGARVIHLVDFDGARSGAPVNLESIGAISSRVAVPLQIAGGVDSADGIRLAFAAGATRVVLTMSVVEDPDRLAACLAVAGDWLAVGLDPRQDRLAAFPWKRPAIPTIDGLVGELVGRGVRRLVLSHGGHAPDLVLLERLARSHDADIVLAGGASDPAAISRIRDAGVAGLILGEALLSGAIDFPVALEAAA